VVRNLSWARIHKFHMIRQLPAPGNNSARSRVTAEASEGPRTRDSARGVEAAQQARRLGLVHDLHAPFSVRGANEVGRAHALATQAEAAGPRGHWAARDTSVLLRAASTQEATMACLDDLPCTAWTMYFRRTAGMRAGVRWPHVKQRGGGIVAVAGRVARVWTRAPRPQLPFEHNRECLRGMS